ncbi:MAG TPA: hypothetical protein GX710_08105, partial [Clostridiales bacterium]|nr:hypothetical protein [Clostridiales bacterium]
MAYQEKQSAFDGEIRIKNISEETIEDWKIEFDFDHKIDRFWTAIIEKQEGNHYYIKNAGYNANIKPGQTVVLGFSGNPGNVIVDIENSVLTQIITEKPSTEPVTDYYKDSDGDGLKDYIEVLLGTNYNKTDTDGDGLSDYEEYYLSETDPLLTDTNNNGVLDGNEDKDDDGIINIEELAIGTAINDNDSDNDGLEDGTEINTYQTNPMNVDTDQDGLTDYEEVMLGLDPTKPMTDGITIDSKRTFSQILSKEMIAEELLGDDKIVYPGISGEVSGLIDKNMMIDVSSYREFDSNRAVIGNVIEIQMTYATADFKLEYDISKIISAYGSDYAKDLLICKLGGENGFEPVDTVLYGTVMTGSITGEGSYFILNLNEFLLDMGINVFGEAEHAEVIETYGFDGDSTIEKDATTVSVTTDTVSLENEIEVLTENGMVIGDERYTVDNNAVYVPEKNDVEVVAADDNQLVKDELPGLMLANADFASIKGIADIVFVIDATGSMQDEISNVAKNLNVFSEELVNEYSVNANFAVVEYQDITWDGVNSTLVHK